MVNAVCLFVAGLVRATIPSPEFTLRWEHSVEKTRWEEVYVVEGASLVLAEASVAGFGAGMEAPPAATLGDGVWSWRPGTRLAEIRLAHSTYARDYVVCTSMGCRALSAIVGSIDGEVVVRPCASP
jgi:hypothetical protein